MSFDQYRTCVVRSVTLELLSAAKADHLLSFPSQVLHLKSVFSSSAEVKAGTKACKEKRPALLASMKASACKVPPKLLGTQILPSYFKLVPSTTVRDYSSYEMCRNLPSSTCSLQWQTRLFSTDPKALLAHECGQLGASI